MPNISQQDIQINSKKNSFTMVCLQTITILGDRDFTC